MNSTSESNSRAWRLIVGVLPIDLRRWMAIKLDVVLFAEQTRAVNGAVGAAIVDQDDLTWLQRLAQDRGETEHDRLRLVIRGNDDIDARRTPILGGVGTVRSGPRNRPAMLNAAFGPRTK